jgi:hypothetical protein
MGHTHNKKIFYVYAENVPANASLFHVRNLGSNLGKDMSLFRIVWFSNGVWFSNSGLS